MPKRVDRAAKREAILEAAVRVFARKGFAASRIEDIAAEAGIAKGSVYLYFDSRDAVLEGVFAAYAERAERVLSSLGDGPPLERLAALIRGTLGMLAEHPDHARVLVDLWSTAAPLDMAALYRDYREVIGGLLEEAGQQLRPGIGRAHAAVIVAAIEGCLVQWLVDPALDLPALAGPVIDVCVEGIRA
ncbi:TetR/AcrR family transcriptional regulator [Nonomuraea sp. NPDC050663]|uniref:TetR/AcrR family transcriptional regulator n=1 Tax=Nonomuraea sp. NPDC050663 TaxID=3364370 RepID=UPI0037A1ED8A